MTWIPALVCLALFVGSWAWNRQAHRMADNAIDKLREATDRYREAKAERHEAYRVLALAVEVDPVKIAQIHYDLDDAPAPTPSQAEENNR